jgi:CheY-like chemotaxis protein/MinD-like ATPase involved in chromosome partitioning or flagellar assembly
MAAKILIVDDDPETVEFLKIILTRQGYQFISADNGVQAISMARREQPELIILDVMMPDIDGYEVARKLRTYPEIAATPILMFTAKAQVEDKVAGYESGVDIYLTKPTHPVELQANIKALLSQRRPSAGASGGQGHVVGVIAAKGGLGVSTTTLNLALSYHRKYNANVVAVELRPGQGSWAAELNFEDPCGLCNLLRMNASEITTASVENQLVTTPYGVRMILASNDTGDIDCISNLEQYEAIIQHLSLLSPLSVLDIGTNFFPAIDVVIDKCDEIIVITEPQPIAVKRTRTLIGELNNKGFGSAKVLTLVTLNHTRSDLTLSTSQIEEAINLPVALGIPPSTEMAYQSAVRSIPICLVQPDSLVAQQFNNLAELVSARSPKW